MERSGAKRNGNHFLIHANGMHLCFELQRSQFNDGWYINIGLSDPTLRAVGNAPPKHSTEWHACARAHKKDSAERSDLFSDDDPLETLQDVVHSAMGTLRQSADRIITGDDKEFPFEVLWIQNVKRELLFQRRRR